MFFFFSLVAQPPAPKNGVHTVHCAVIPWRLKIGPSGKSCPFGPFMGPIGFLCFRFPRSWYWMSMSTAALLFPSTSNDSWLTSNNFWLTSNNLLLTSNDFWMISYDFRLTSNDFWLTFIDFWLMPDSFLSTSNAFWMTSQDLVEF